jgi:hypothetical protein
MAERTHKLRKIESGDYLLPDDYTQTLWRIHRYRGLSTGGRRGLVKVQRWGIWRYKEPLDGDGAIKRWEHPALVKEGWSSWKRGKDGCSTRTEAIRAALRWRRAR